MQGIHAPCPSLGACISLARDARVGAGMSCLQRIHVPKCFLRPAVLAVGPLCIFEVFTCMSYDWGITIIVHMHKGLNMFGVQTVICLSSTGATLERSHTFVTGDVVQVQRG